MHLFLFLLTGCVLDRTGKSTSSLMKNEIANSQKRLSQIDKQVRRLDDRLSEVEEANSRKGREDLEKLENVEQVRDEIASMRNEVEVLNYNFEKLSSSMDNQSTDVVFRLLWLEDRAKNLEKTLEVPTPNPPTVNTSTNATGGSETTTEPENKPVVDNQPENTTNEPVQTDPDALLKKAKDHLAAGRESAAEIILKKLITQHKKHKKMPEFLYRYAEAAFNDGEFKEAVGRFQAVIDNNKTSTWAAWAMLGQGESFDALSRPANAKLFYEDVIKLYPKTKAAKEAKKKLSK